MCPKVAARVASVLLLLGACAPADSLDLGDPFSEGGKGDDGNSLLIDHGPALFLPDLTYRVEISGSRPMHYWSFTVGDDATIALHGEARGNTVPMLYVYQPWVDEAGKPHWKQLAAGIEATSIVLPAGEYRVLAHASNMDIVGAFDMTMACTGPGCATTQCALGTRWSDYAALNDGLFAVTDLHQLGTGFGGDGLMKTMVPMVAERLGLGPLDAAGLAAIADDGEVLVGSLEQRGSAYRYNLMLFSRNGLVSGAVLSFAGRSMLARISDGVIDQCTLVPISRR
jgi:hypothetical protein